MSERKSRHQFDPAPPAPRAATVAVAAVMGLAAGLGLVKITMGAPPPGLQQATESPSDDDASAIPFEAQLASEAEAEAPQSPEPATEPVPEPEPGPEAEAEPEPVPGPTRSVTRVRVAYIRCGAAGNACGRDRDFEEAVWSKLSELSTCADRPANPGTADLRLRVAAGGNEARFRDWGDSALPVAPLETCLSTSLSTVRTTLRHDPLVVSFRFQYE